MHEGPRDDPELAYNLCGTVAFRLKLVAETRHGHLSCCEAWNLST
jgi:hypothetical protein